MTTPAPFNCRSNVLADESRRVLDAVAAPLEQLLMVDYSFQRGSLEHMQPVLQVHLWMLRDFSTMASADIRAILDAVAMLARHSRRLNSHPDLKADFWTQILTSTMMFGNSSDDAANGGGREIERTVERWVVQSGFEPCILLEFQHNRVTENCMDALLKFMTTHTESTNEDAEEENTLVAPDTIAFGLSFYRCRMEPTGLEMIEQLLDQIFAHPDRQFSIDVLDLRRIAMAGPELAVVASILKKKTVYRLQQMLLDSLVCKKPSPEQNSGLSTVLRAALEHHGATSARDPEKPLEAPNATSFRKVSLSSNWMGVEQYAAMGSMLRYGCAIEELSLEDTINHPYSTASDRMQCWRWLAFGLFYPRSRRFDSNDAYRLRKIQISWYPFAEEVEAFTKTLKNPVGELLRGAGGESAVDESVVAVNATKVMICSVKKDAKVYAAPMSTARTILILDETSELEALHEQDSWVCVVVAGFGLGWVPTDQVVVMERESAAGDVVRYDLELSGMFRLSYGVRGIVSFIKSIGSQLSALDLRAKQAGQSALVTTVVTHCVNIERLNLSRCNIKYSHIRALLEGLRPGGAFHDKLISLNLNFNRLSDAAVRKLAAILSNREDMPVLRELRLVSPSHTITEAGLASLHSALRVNKRLEFLELARNPKRRRDRSGSDVDEGDGYVYEYESDDDDEEDSYTSDEDDQHDGSIEPTGDYSEQRDRLNAAYQNELLRIALPLESKLAFLSVLTPPSFRGVARNAVDSSVVDLVFQFAGEARKQTLKDHLAEDVDEGDGGDCGEEEVDDAKVQRGVLLESSIEGGWGNVGTFTLRAWSYREHACGEKPHSFWLSHPAARVSLLTPASSSPVPLASAHTTLRSETRLESMKPTAKSASVAAVFAFAGVLAPGAAVHGADLLQHGAGVNGANCLDVRSVSSEVVSSWCTGGDTQLFDMVDRHTLRFGAGSTQCLQFSADNSVVAAPCVANSVNQQWRAKYDGSIAATGYAKFGKCLTANSTVDGAATLQACTSGTPSQVFRSSSLVADASDVLTANGVCLNYVGGTSATTLSCHGNANQLWTYTFDEEIRNADANCLEYDEVNAATVTMAKCSGASKQKWSLDATSGKVTPSAKPARCLDFTNYAPVLVACGTPLPKTQVFNANALLGACDRNLKRTMIQAPGIYTGTNCVTVNRATKDVHIAPCSKNADMWWEVTSTKTIELAGEQCIDLSSTEAGRVTYSTCNGQANQQWSWNAATGLVASVAQPDKCLTFSTVNVTGWENIKFSAQTCGTTAKPLENQILRPRDFSDILPPYSRADAQQTFCSQRAQRPNDLRFLRDTLFWSKKDVKALVPTTLTNAREEYNYYASVVVESLSAVLNTDSNLLTEAQIVDKLGAVTNGVKALFDLSELMCRVRERDAEVHPKISDWLNIDKPANTRLVSVVNYLRMANLQLQLTVLPIDSALLDFVASHVARSINEALQRHLSNNDLAGLNTFVSSEDMSWFAQLVQPLCTARPTLAICSATFFPGLILARQDLLDEITKTTLTSLKTNELITMDVLAKADAFMQIFHNGLASGSPVDASAWQSFVQLTIFGATKPVTAYPSSDLLRTTSNSELMMILTLWPHFTTEEMSSATWSPFFTAFSDQFHEARRLAIQRIVYASRAQTLEAYFDGRSSDMDRLATQVLPRVCARFPAFRACALIEFHTLTNARAELQRRIKAVGGQLTDEIQALAATFATVFGSSVALDDELWTMTAVRLLFNSVELQVFPAATLLTTATPNAFLMLYTVFAHYSNGMAPLLPYFTFLSDQVSAAHFSAINKLVADRNVDGMLVYVDPLSNATTSDLGVFGEVVLPLLCNNPNNPDFSVCKLQDFYAGLMRVLSFEKSRRARTISLVDVAEVDVRKQLDVIDGESKQFEIITTIQDSANQIGQKVQEESEKIQAVVVAESAAIRADIASSTRILYEKMGEEGRALQAQIDASTRELEDTIGAAADVIRQDIADNTQLLYEKMDDDARALQRSIDESTRKLSTQIGAEAQATRNSINDATNKLYNKIGAEGQAIRGKIDESTSKLYNKIGEEGQAIRTKIDQSTDKLYSKIGEEGQKTRDKVDESTRQLTTVINTSTAKLESKIATSTSTTVAAFKSQFSAFTKSLPETDKSAMELLKNLRVSVESAKNYNKEMQEKVQPLLDTLSRATSRLLETASAKDWALGLSAVATAMEAATGLMGYYNPIANLFGVADDGYVEMSMVLLDTAVNGMTAEDEATEHLKSMADSVRFYCSELVTIMQEFASLRKELGNIDTFLGLLGKSDSAMTKADSDALINTILKAYKQFKNPADKFQFDASFLKEHASTAFKWEQRYVDAQTVKDISAADKQIESVYSAYTEMYGKLSEEFESLNDYARIASGGASAQGLILGSLFRRRRLQQTASTFKPLYAMAYAGLSKLFMEYKMQDAAFQFCKYYEYKLGGTPPPMCGSTKFYTSADIQAMRSYQPPTLEPFSIVALLPTKPTPAGDDTSSDPIKLRPYLDLERLAAGEKVSFSLPATDLAWLKRYNWIYFSDSNATLAGLYIQSMQIMLPFTSTSNGSSSSSGSFKMATTVEIGSTQRLSPTNGKMYVVPATTLRFTSEIKAPLCGTKITNPYHEAANCVKTDRSSDVCIYEAGKVTSTDILPSVFSRWQISMPLDTGANTGSGYKLALPSTSEPDAVDLDVVVLLKGVRAFASSSAMRTTTMETPESIGIDPESVCCASDEHFVPETSSCAKCPAGSTGALNGYSCQRV